MKLNRSMVYRCASSALMLASFAAAAHHSITANFDGSREVEIRGTVVDFKLRSPHSSVVVDGYAFIDGVQQSDGVERWEIESSAAPGLRQRGIGPDTFRPGDGIVVVGTPHRDSALKRANASDFRSPRGESFGDGSAFRFHPQFRANLGLGPPPHVEVTATGVERVAGRWQPPFLVPGETSALPLNDAGLAAWRAYDQTRSPANSCEPMSFPVVNNAPGYFMDIRFEGDVAVVRNQAYDIVRRVPLDGAEAPADPEGRFGLVRGKVEETTLVVDSRGFPPSPWGLGAATQINGGGADVPSSPDKVLTERFSVSVDAQTLIYEYTLNDPVYMSRPHTARIELQRVPDEVPMYPYNCEEDAASMFSRPPGESLLDRD